MPRRCAGASSAREGTGLAALYRKELSDHLNSKRFLLIFALLLVVTTASLGGAVTTLFGGSTESTEFLFLRLFTTGSSSIYSFATFLAFLGPLAGITLGFDAVNTERSQGTLIRLAAQPIYRDAILNAKFLAGATVIGLIVAALGLYFLFLCATGTFPREDFRWFYRVFHPDKPESPHPAKSSPAPRSKSGQ